MRKESELNPSNSWQRTRYLTIAVVAVLASAGAFSSRAFAQTQSGLSTIQGFPISFLPTQASPRSRPLAPQSAHPSLAITLTVGILGKMWMHANQQHFIRRISTP